MCKGVNVCDEEDNTVEGQVCMPWRPLITSFTAALTASFMAVDVPPPRDMLRNERISKSHNTCTRSQITLLIMNSMMC